MVIPTRPLKSQVGNTSHKGPACDIQPWIDRKGMYNVSALTNMIPQPSIYVSQTKQSQIARIQACAQRAETLYIILRSGQG